MAKSKAPKIKVDVSGMTLKSIMELDPTHLTGLSRSSLAEITSRLASAANKRLTRLEKTGLDYSPAYRGRVPKGEEKAKRFSVAGKKYHELQHEFARARDFLINRKTSSVAGARKSLAEMETRIGRHFETKEEANLFWDNVKKLEEMHVLNQSYTSGQLQKDVAQMMDSMSFDEMLNRITNRSEQAYLDALNEGTNPFEIVNGENSYNDEGDEEEE